MGISNQLKNQHLLWRAGFGPDTVPVEELSSDSNKKLIKAIFKASEKTPAYIDVADPAVKEIYIGMEEMYWQKRQLTEEQRKLIRDRSREGIRALNLTWLNQMVHSEQQLREKASLFWHGHFACRTVNIVHQQQLLDAIRRNALGNFPDLLREVSKSGAMLNFLNNNQNRKDHPNENFAREVMELFTLGRGNYTEDDIKEAARAFTGWGSNASGNFVFRKNQHDTGKKKILGKSGNFDGGDVLNILIEQPQTAQYITRKVYRYFVNESENEEQIKWLSDRFYKNGYNIAALFQDIFTSDWFYDQRNVGAIIKSPVLLIAGIRRAIPMEISNEEVQITLQRLLGQQLFYPPNVAGWPGGKNWIDSSSLMLRLRIPQMIYAEDTLTLKPKDDDDQMMGMKDKENRQQKMKAFAQKRGGGQVISATVNWDAYTKLFTKVSRENLLPAISSSVLQTSNSVTVSTLDKYLDNSSRENYIRSATIQLMSTPEYQLC
jgi:uncharacterized protein (DUF1800 family)